MNSSDQHDRPNPDLLLEAIRKEEDKSGRGKLKIFLGMAAGVGKTYTMLSSARGLMASGVDVVIALVETHGRRETEVLLEGLPVIPRRVVPYRNVVLDEMDLDAVLKRNPRVVLVDEAAHTNAPGSRHAKRYLDILEILDSGIDVYTTLNVQHIESRADTVREITGITVTETVPDSFIDIADEVVLVDLVPEELLKRLEEGKVYIPQNAVRAAQNFFRPENLTALRELALRMVAERVNRDLRDYQQLYHITGTWKTRHRLMVAIYASPYSETLIRWTRRMAAGLDAEWYGVYIESDKPLSDHERSLLSRNLSLVKELGGEVLTTVDDDPVRGILRLAREHQVTQIVVGKSRRGFLQNLFRGGSIVERLLNESGNIDIYIVTGEPKDATTKDRFRLAEKRQLSPARDFIIAAVVPAVVTILCRFILPVFGYHAIGLVFLFAVTVLGLFIGRGAILLAAILSGLAWDLFFIPPHYTFAISQPADYLMLGMYMVAAVTVGHLTSRLKQNERQLRVRERRVTALYHLTREIASAKSLFSILNTAVEYLGEIFEAEVAVFVKNPAGGLDAHPGNTLQVDEKEMSVAAWTAIHNRPAGLFTDTLPAASAYYLPLVASQGIVGVLGLKPRRRRPATPELMNIVEVFARQLAVGIEREQLNDIAHRTMLIQESERLYRSILNSVSHELKTPLAAIEGSASALLDPHVVHDAAAVGELASEIQHASGRLSRLVRNLIDMTRLESGAIPLRKEHGDIRDLIGTTLRLLDKELAGRNVTVNIADDTPILPFDFLLMQQAVSNILHNAAVYTPPGTPIEIRGIKEKDFYTLEFRDHGPGLPADPPSQVFEKFWRGDPHKPGGTGLGLAIAKGWVEAHGGSIEAHNHPDGGALFVIHLPLESKS